MNVILLNSNYEFLNNISWQKAICLITKGKVEVLKYTDRIIRNFDGSVIMKIPAIMRIIKFVRTLYKTKVPFSKRNVLVRDGFTCAYCGTKSKNLTIDHIVPKSRGGKSTWENTVASCKKCNARKGNKSCVDAEMFPSHRAYQPTIHEFLRIKFNSMGIDKVLREYGVY